MLQLNNISEKTIKLWFIIILLKKIEHRSEILLNAIIFIKNGQTFYKNYWVKQNFGLTIQFFLNISKNLEN